MIRKALILLVLMLGASFLSVALIPTVKTSTTQIDLAALVPLRFGDWREEENLFSPIVNPQTQEMISQIYSQTLSRVYINNDGRRIMLSLAYGADQSHDNQIHRPEVCYPAQGFRLVEKKNVYIKIGETSVPAMRIVAKMGARIEPVTYWIRLGDVLIRGNLEQGITRARLGLQGYIPDGILFRISEINTDVENSFILQDRFISDMITNLSPDARRVLIGNLGATPAL